MKSFKRVERVAPLIQQILSDLVRNRIQDPRVQNSAITNVQMKDDLQLAKVYFEVTPGTNPDEALAGYEKAAGFLRREMARQLDMKYIPQLRFYYDDRHEHVARVEAILKNLEDESK